MFSCHPLLLSLFVLVYLLIGPQAVVARPRDCTMCRECIRDPEREKRIKLRRVRDHFICTFVITY